MHRKSLTALIPFCLLTITVSTVAAQTTTSDSSYINRGTSWLPKDDLERAIRDLNVEIAFHPNSAVARCAPPGAR